MHLKDTWFSLVLFMEVTKVVELWRGIYLQDGKVQGEGMLSSGTSMDRVHHPIDVFVLPMWATRRVGSCPTLITKLII